MIKSASIGLCLSQTLNSE